MIDFIEQQALANGQMRQAALEGLRKRAHDLTVLLLGGGGGLGGFGLGQSVAPDWRVAFLAASLWCFAMAALVVLGCLRSRAVWPLHNTPAVLQRLMEGLVADPEFGLSGALLEMRWRELGRLNQAIDSLNQANAGVAKWLNWGYRGAALLPLAALMGWLLA